MADVDALLELRHVRKVFRGARTGLFGPRSETTALGDVSFCVKPGERFGIVGESGSGKSTILKIIAGLIEPTDGEIRYRQEVIPTRRSDKKQFRKFQHEIQVIFQDPMGSLDPRMRVRDIVAEPMIAQGKRVASGRIEELLQSVGISPNASSRYPHQFSGGQRQRIAIARALSTEPSLLLADEAVSALDVSVRAQILNLLNDLLPQFDTTMIFVSHDLSVVRFMCDRLAVMQGGAIVETGETQQVLSAPADPYTQRLLASAPSLKRIGSPSSSNPRSE